MLGIASAWGIRPLDSLNVGVTCVLGPDGLPLQWSAHTYIAPGQLLQKTFSVYRYGDDAQKLAIAERQKQLEQMEGRARLHPVEEQVRSSSAKKASRRSIGSDGSCVDLLPCKLPQ